MILMTEKTPEYGKDVFLKVTKRTTKSSKGWGGVRKYKSISITKTTVGKLLSTNV
jgi:hypothetical protein